MNAGGVPVGPSVSRCPPPRWLAGVEKGLPGGVDVPGDIAEGDRLRAIVDRSADAIVVVDEGGTVLFANPAAESLFERGPLAGEDFGFPTMVERTEVDIVRTDGLRVAEMRVTAMEWGDRPARLALLRDITQRKETERELRLAGLVFDNATEGLAIADADGLVLKINDAFAAITGLGVEAATGAALTDLLADEGGDGELTMATRALEEIGRWEGEIARSRPDGGDYVVWVTLLQVVDEGGVPTNEVAILNDITGWKQAQQRLDHLAHYDPLTELPNRIRFQEALERAVPRAVRNDGGVAVLFLDLDGFKAVNDELGHAAGDILLHEAGQRLKAETRGGDMVARLGGDEFIVLLEDADADGAARVADKLIAALERPFGVVGQYRRVDASVGISLAPGDGRDPDALVRNADAAMYRAKSRGPGNWSFVGAAAD